MKYFTNYWPHIRNNNLMGEAKSKVLFNELILTENVEGNICEIGCFQGKTSKMMNMVFPHKILELYDTFEGVQGVDPTIDVVPNGIFACPLDEVKAFVGENNVQYFKGFFPNTFDNTKDTKYSFIHSDTDTYIGTKSTLDVMWDRVSVNGILMFDDYIWKDCPGVEKAVHEWLPNRTDCITRITPYQIAIQKTK